MWQDTTTSDGGTDQAVKLFVSANRKLQVTGCDALDAKILGCVTCQLEHLGGEIFQDGGCVDGGFGADTDVVLGSVLQVTVDTTDRELFECNQNKRQKAEGSVISVYIAGNIFSTRCIHAGAGRGDCRLEMLHDDVNQRRLPSILRQAMRTLPSMMHSSRVPKSNPC